MATTIVSNNTAATHGNSPQKTGEPLDHATLYSGKALEFDGVGDYLSCASNLSITNNITISCWVNTTNAEGNIIYQGYNYDGNEYGWILSMGTNDHGNTNANSVTFSSHDNSSNENSNCVVQTDADQITENVWHHIVVTKSDTSVVIYIDGVSNKTGNVDESTIGYSSSHGDYATGYEIFIGKPVTTHANYFKNYLNGKLSNLQVWDTAWSATDVQYAYLNPESLITSNSSVSGSQTTSNLKLWYPMNDTGVRSPQTVVFDAAGTNNTTKNHAATTFTGDELMTTNRGSFTNSGGELRNGSVINSGAATHNAFYEIATQGSSSDLFGKGSPIDDNSDWNAGTGWTADASNQKLTASSATTNISATPTTTVSNGDYVTITYTIANYSAGSVRFIINGNKNGTTRSANGTYTESVIVTGSATALLYFDGVTAFTGEISNITMTRSVDFTLFGAPDNYPGSVFCMNHSD